MLGAEIREFRRELGMTQGQFAELLGMSRVYLANIECGNKQVTGRVRRLVRMVKGLVLVKKKLEGNDRPLAHDIRGMIDGVLREKCDENT